MRKILTILLLISLFAGMASAGTPVVPSSAPTYKIGPSMGFRTLGTAQAGDVYATDDLKVGDDAWIMDDMWVNGTLTVGVFSSASNVTTGHLTEDLTVDDGVDITAATGAEIFDYSASTSAYSTAKGTNTLNGNVVIANTKTFTTGTGLSTFLGNIYVSGTKTFTMGTGLAQFGGQVTGATIKGNTSIYSAGTLNSAGTATLNAVTVNTTVNAAADGIRANSIILPGEMVITVPITKTDFAAGELNRSIFIADDAWTITSIEEVHNVAEGTATTCTLAVQKMTGTQALTGGINVTTAAFNLKGAANTVQTGTLSTTSGRTTLADGNRLGLLCNMTGTNAMNAYRGGVLTIHMKRV